MSELRELQELTGDENGSQRVAWTDTWETARRWLREKVASTGAEEQIDEAGNQWFTLPGQSDRALLIGGHIDIGMDSMAPYVALIQEKKLRGLAIAGAARLNE